MHLLKAIPTFPLPTRIHGGTMSPAFSTRAVMLVCALALCFLFTPSQTEAQDLEAAIVDVLDWLDEGYELIPEMGQWGLVFGWFAEGEDKEIRFTASAGESYMLAGGGDANSEDLDICVYDQYGDEVECDTLTDNYPIVEFTAESSGTYRAVLSAFSLSGSTSYAGMAILRRH